MTQRTWQMTGFTEHHELAAMNNQQYVATRFDPTALINATSETGNPYSGPKTGLAVGKKTPPVGTRVTLIFVGPRSVARTPTKAPK